jgi:hypothetical protein
LEGRIVVQWLDPHLMSMSMKGLAVAVVGACCASASLGSAAAVTTPTRWFHSPSGNIQCEVASNGGTGAHAYCQTFSPARSAQLTANGALRVCRGVACLGNGPTTSTRLAYGSSIRVGPFACTSLTAGVRCIVVSSRRGFTISRGGIKQI